MKDSIATLSGMDSILPMVIGKIIADQRHNVRVQTA